MRFLILLLSFFLLQSVGISGISSASRNYETHFDSIQSGSQPAASVQNYMNRDMTINPVFMTAAVNEESSRRSEQNRMLGIGLMIMLIPGSIFVYIYFYRTYSRRFKFKPELREIRYSPPSNLSPALVRALMLGPLSAEPDKLSLGITLFDLSRRGYFRIVEKAGEKKFMGSEIPLYALEKTGKKLDDTLSSWELMLLEKVNHRIDEGVTRLDNILGLATRPGKKWWKQWRKEFKKTIRETGWYDPNGYKVMLFHSAAQLPFLLGSIATILLAGAAGVIALIVTVIMMSLTLTLQRYTQNGIETHAVWSAYRKALKKGPNHLFNHDEIGRNFVYAIAIGLTKKQLEKRLGDVDSESQLFYWIVPAAGTTNPAGIATGLSTLASSGTSRFSGMSGPGKSS